MACVDDIVNITPDDESTTALVMNHVNVKSLLSARSHTKTKLVLVRGSKTFLQGAETILGFNGST